MAHHILTTDTFKRLSIAERTLHQRHGIRLRVDLVSADGRYALCTACQVKTPLFGRPLPEHNLAELAHFALKRLLMAGINPLITMLPPGSANGFAAMEKKDPFQLIQALHALDPKVAVSLGHASVSA
jgi:hypothetical protein